MKEERNYDLYRQSSTTIHSFVHSFSLIIINHYYLSLGWCHLGDGVTHNRNTLIEESKCGRFKEHVSSNRRYIFGQWHCERSYFRGDDKTLIFLRRFLREMMNICICCLCIMHTHANPTRIWVSSKLITSHENTIVMGIGFTEVSKSSDDLIVAWNAGFSKFHIHAWNNTAYFGNMIFRKSEWENQDGKQEEGSYSVEVHIHVMGF